VKASLQRALAKCKEFASGQSFGNGYHKGQHISAGADGDVFKAACRKPEDIHYLCNDNNDSNNSDNNTTTNDKGGGHGKVREVAVKQMRLSSVTIQRHAAQELSSVFFAKRKYAEEVGADWVEGHPNIIAYLDWFGNDRELCLVMECCDFTLSDMIYTVGSMRSQYERRFKEMKVHHTAAAAAAGQPKPSADAFMFRHTEYEVVKVFCQMLVALAFLNRASIVHHDIKSDNILWKAPAEGTPVGCYKLADFGTASFMSEGDANFKNCGTLWTMAPELLGRRSHDVNCDIWSLAVVIFEFAILEKPFGSKELLAYKNSHEASAEGRFWSFLCNTPAASKVGQQGSAKSVGGAGPSPTNTSSAKRMDRTTSVPTLPAVTSGRGAGGRGGSPTDSIQQMKNVRSASNTAAAAVSPAASAQNSLQQQQQQQQTSSASSSCSPSPTPPLSPKMPPSARSQKWSFLRKRSLNRWCYSPDLRTFLFEDCLEELPKYRPNASEALRNPLLQKLARGQKLHFLPRKSTEILPSDLDDQIQANNSLEKDNDENEPDLDYGNEAINVGRGEDKKVDILAVVELSPTVPEVEIPSQTGPQALGQVLRHVSAEIFSIAMKLHQQSPQAL